MYPLSYLRRVMYFEELKDEIPVILPTREELIRSGIKFTCDKGIEVKCMCKNKGLVK